MEALCRRRKYYSRGPVPSGGARVVRDSTSTFVMLGLTFFSASMWTGGTLGTGLSYNDFFLAKFSSVISPRYLHCISGYLLSAQKPGLSPPTSLHVTSLLNHGFLAAARRHTGGWFGVGVAMFAIPSVKATGIDAKYPDCRFGSADAP